MSKKTYTMDNFPTDILSQYEQDKICHTVWTGVKVRYEAALEIINSGPGPRLDWDDLTDEFVASLYRENIAKEFAAERAAK